MSNQVAQHFCHRALQLIHVVCLHGHCSLAPAQSCLQLSAYGEHDVEGANAVGVVFPMALHLHTGLATEPWQVVVVVAVIHWVGGLSGGGGVGHHLVQLVAIVTCKRSIR